MKKFKFDNKKEEISYYFNIRIEYLEEQLKKVKNPFVNRARIKLAKQIKKDILEILEK